jgi:hypothetical protein
LPGFIPSIDAVDVERLSAILDSPECQEFRQWIRSMGQSTDAEFTDRVKSIRVKLGSAFQAPIGKAIRFAVSNGIGILAVVPGLAASVLDSFILNSLL